MWKHVSVSLSVSLSLPLSLHFSMQQVCVCAVSSVMVYVGGGASDVEACISTRWKHVSEVFASLPLPAQPWDQRTHSLLKVLNSESVVHFWEKGSLLISCPPVCKTREIFFLQGWGGRQNGKLS